MKKYINTSNYYLSTITSEIKQDDGTAGSFDVADVTVDGVTLPLEGYYWVDVDFGDVSKREIFRIVKREGYTLTYDARISPYGMKTHDIGTTVALRDFSQLLNSLSTNTDNFGEVEELGGLNILVRGGNVFSSGDASGVSLINKKTLSLPASSTVYIVLNYTSPELLSVAEFDVVEEITDAGMYPIAKIITTSTGIESVEDLRSTMIYGGGEGDMKWVEWKEKYLGSEEATKEGNIYDMDNMEQGTNNLYTNPEEKIYWNAKQQQLVSGQNIVTINGKSIIDVSQWEGGNIPLDTILTAGWHTYTTEDGASSFTFNPQWYPLTEDAFIVFSDSGTMLTKGGTEPNDYTYSDVTHTITFKEPLADNEHAIIWTMYNNTDSAVGIGSGTIQLQRNGVTIPNGQFNVNQDDIDGQPQAIELGDLASNAQITFTQGGIPDKTITLNQENNDAVNLSGIIPISQEGYEDLDDSKLTDNNWYFIIE